MKKIKKQQKRKLANNLIESKILQITLGTEAWVDASGFLRQKDYIADKDGYRILKSKTIFIGKNRPIKASSYFSFNFSS